MQAIYAITALCLVVSLIASGQRTARALRIALRRFLRISPAFLVMLILKLLESL